MTKNQIGKSAYIVAPGYIIVYLPVKGAFALGKKIVKVSYSGVAVWGSRAVGE